MKSGLRTALLAGLVLATTAFPASAAEEKQRPWSDTAELALVATTGNSETENLAFRNEFTYKWEKSTLEIKAGALRTNTTTRMILNLEPGLVVSETSETTAERYFIFLLLFVIE